MQNRLRALVAVLIALFALSPAHAAPSVADAVKAALDAQAEAWTRGDLSGFLAAYDASPNVTLVAGGQVIKGGDAIRQRFTDTVKPPMGALHYKDVDVVPLGADHAVVIGRFVMERNGQVVAEGMVTMAWAKTAAGWRIVQDHRSPAPAASASKTTLPGGLVVEDLAVGNGEPAIIGKTVSVHYTGWLQNGTKFDSSLDRGQPFEFVLGQRQVIPGWDQGVQGMRVGGKRRLTIPPALGYGARGAGGVIPPNATLIFEVELLSVK